MMRPVTGPAPMANVKMYLYARAKKVINEDLINA
jgi:hypothetical protein